MKLILRSILGYLIISVFYLSEVNAQKEVLTVRYKYESVNECTSDTGSTYLTYHLRPDIMRLDFKGPTSNSSMIYQPSSQKVWVLYRHEKCYFTMTAEDFQILEDQIASTKEEMKRSQQGMSEQDKKSYDALWPNGSPFDVENTTYSLVKKKDSLVSQLICKRYDGLLKNGSVKRVFANNLKSTGLKDDQLAILTLFSEFIGESTRILAGNMDFVFFKKWDFGAYPILIENRKNEVLCSSILLQEIFKQKRNDDFFVIPNGYNLIDNPVGKQH